MVSLYECNWVLVDYVIKGEGVGVGSSLPETAAGMGILAGFEGIFGVFKTSSKSGFGLHSFGVSACV